MGRKRKIVVAVVKPRGVCECGRKSTTALNPLTGKAGEPLCRACAEDVVRRSVAGAYGKPRSSPVGHRQQVERSAQLTLRKFRAATKRRRKSLS